MSLLPYDRNEEIVVQKTEVKPTSSTDPPGLWWKFLDGLRIAIGFKPFFLAERWSVAKVRALEVEVEAKEADNHIKLLKAKVEAEQAMVAMRITELEAKTRVEKEKVISQHLAAQAKDAQARARITELTAKMLDDAERSPTQIEERLRSIIGQIQSYGGCVELEIPEDGKVGE